MQEATTARLDGRRLLALIEDATDPVLITAGDTTIEYASPSFDRVFGVKPLLLIGRPLRDFVHPEDRDVLEDLVGRTREHAGHFFHGEMRFGRGMGDWRLIALSARNRGDGESGGITATCRDVSAQHRLESQLRESQKFEAIGQLAAGIAHEINTPTQFVSDNVRFLDGAAGDLLAALEACERLLAAIEGGGAPGAEVVTFAASAIRSADPAFLRNEVPAAIHQSLEGLDRIASIARGVRAFSMAGSGEKRQVDLNAEIENTVAVSRNEWKYVSEVVLDLDRTLPGVECVPAEINQVILNLLINAAHAIEESGGTQATTLGRITVSTRHGGTSAEIRVRDTGTGIPDHARSKVFDPFFTTKAPGRGTGQGLAIARTIIAEKHGGSIEFESRVGEGTEFIVTLPLSPANQSVV